MKILEANTHKEFASDQISHTLTLLQVMPELGSSQERSRLDSIAGQGIC
jgi:hypothetical protein